MHLQTKNKEVNSVTYVCYICAKDCNDWWNSWERVSNNEDDVATLQKRVSELEKDNAYLKEKADDQENRKSAEGRDMVAFIQRLIPTLLGRENFPTAPMVERAHRTPAHISTPRPGRPRPILVKLLNFQDKVKIMRLARERETLSWEGARISIYPDFSPEVVKRRREFDNVKKKLRVANIKYSLQYPSTLRVIVGGKPKHFRCPKEAEAFFRDTSSLPGQET
uniref:L1 transposable element RRM domain-containing protein n=1 Tax=Acanthochromis polyacanthus TaxID=80966 RepID=A0A3Q1ETJ7_9TELE